MLIYVLRTPVPCPDPHLRTWLDSGIFCSFPSMMSLPSLMSCSRSKATSGTRWGARKRRWNSYTVSTDSHSLLFPESHQQPWNNNCAPSGAQAIDNSLPSHSVLGSSFCSPLVSAQLVQQCFSFSPEAASPCSFQVRVGLWCWMLVS